MCRISSADSCGISCAASNSSDAGSLVEGSSINLQLRLAYPQSTAKERFSEEAPRCACWPIRRVQPYSSYWWPICRVRPSLFDEGVLKMNECIRCLCIGLSGIYCFELESSGVSSSGGQACIGADSSSEYSSWVDSYVADSSIADTSAA